MKIKNSLAAKIFVILLIAIMIAATVLMYGYAAEKKEKKTEEKRIKSFETMINSDLTACKDETVYVIADAEGKPKQVIVSDWLKNPEKAEKIKDKTELKDITNVEGNENYVIDKENMKIWNAEGKDIHYQGKTDKALPVDLKVTYSLNGKNISAEDLAGKDGRVKIRFDYINNEYKNVNINGKTQRIYVPFVMMTGTILENKNFTDIHVSNGKIINDGKKSMVMGFAMPGLQENLGISKNKLQIPSSVEIEADVKDFSLMTTMTLASNDVFNNIDTSDLNNAGNLNEEINKFAEAAQQLTDGSSALYDGASQLLEKSGEITAAIDQLYMGSEKLSNGASQFSEGTQKLAGGITELNNGLKQLDAGGPELVQGSKQVFNVLLQTANTQLQANMPAGVNVPSLTIENYDSVLTKLEKMTDPENVRKTVVAEAQKKVEGEVRKNSAEIRGKVELGVKMQVTNAVLKNAGISMKAEQFAQAVKAGKADETSATKIYAAVDQQMKSKEIQGKIDAVTEAKIKEITAQQMQSETVKKQIEAAIANVPKESGEQIKSLKKSLDEYGEFHKGVQQYTAGVNKAYVGSGKLVAGAEALNSGSGSFAEGSEQLMNGLGTLRTGFVKFNDGVEKLTTGSMELSEGMKKFNEEGVKKITNVLGGTNIGDITARLKATVDVSKSYTDFAGKNPGTDSDVKFVYKTAEIEKSKKAK